MPGINTNLTPAVEAYFEDLRRIRASGGGAGETSYYPAPNNLLMAVGEGQSGDWHHDNGARVTAQDGPSRQLHRCGHHAAPSEGDLTCDHLPPMLPAPIP